jgi:hypothetical protein
VLLLTCWPRDGAAPDFFDTLQQSSLIRLRTTIRIAAGGEASGPFQNLAAALL